MSRWKQVNLATTHPRVSQEWHPTKNGVLTPADVSHGIQRKVWWLCSEAHEYEAWIHARARGTGCPACFKVRASRIRKGRLAPWVRERLLGKKANLSPEGRDRLAAAARSRARPEAERVARRKASGKNATLKQRYGITLVEYTALVEAQGGVCAICGKKCSSGKNLAVDHDHATGEVRGLLCRRCNRGIGHFEDAVNLLQKAIEYLLTKRIHAD